MKLLILGGTNFVGRAITEDALAHGSDITLVHRGNQQKPAHWKVKEIFCDRTQELTSLQGTWDAVIDVSGYQPSVVEKSALHLRPNVGQYLFISTVSVYDATDDGKVIVRKPLDTDAPITGETYGALKLACENRVFETYGTEAIIIRPGLVAGAYDSTLRFPFWVDRIDRYRSFVTLKDAAALQQIDARDLAQFTNRCLSNSYHGAHLAVGEILDFESALKQIPGYDECKRMEVEEKELSEIGLSLPLLMPEGPGAKIRQVIPAASIPLGLKLRPFAETAADALQWIRSLPDRESRFDGIKSGDRLINQTLEEVFLR